VGRQKPQCTQGSVEAAAAAAVLIGASLTASL